MERDDGLLARLATELPRAQWHKAYRLLVGECPSKPPEQSEECSFEQDERLTGEAAGEEHSPPGA